MKILKTKKFKKRSIYWVILFAAAVVTFIIIVWPTSEVIEDTSPTAVTTTSKSAQKKLTTATKVQYSTNKASSLWVVVNKGRVLPADYRPSAFGALNLRTEASKALANIFKAADNGGLPMKLTSGYRSYSSQQSIYGGYVKTYGQASADRFSARPGHSEHQTGLAADVEPSDGRCRLDQCFGATAEGKWLAANAWRYGFVIRYQKDQENLTGYSYEPWHIRYIGPTLAADIHRTGQTLEQFFGLQTYSLSDAYPTNFTQLE